MWLWTQDWTFQEAPGDPNLFLVPVLGQDKMDQGPEGKQDGSHEGKWLQSCKNWDREPGLGAVSRWGTRSGSHEGRSRPLCSGSQGTWGL